MGRFLDFILARDELGYDLTLNYKGNDTHPSKVGAFFSIAI